MPIHERAGAATDLHHSFELYALDTSLPDLYGKDILVAGTGMLNDVVLRLNTLPGTNAVGINPILADRDFCKAAQIPTDKQTNVVASYYEDGMPFKDTSFDAIISARSLFWLNNYEDFPALLAEAQRILKPGGEMHLFPVQAELLYAVGYLSMDGWSQIHTVQKEDSEVDRIYKEFHHGDRLESETSQNVKVAYRRSLHLKKQ